MSTVALALLIALTLPTLTLCQVGLVGTLPEYQITARVGQPSYPVPPGAEFMGVGYDVVFGNPASLEVGSMMDPGYRKAVIQNEYRLEDNTDSYQEPIGANLKGVPVCNHATLAQEIDTLSQYSDFLAFDVNILVPIFAPHADDDKHLQSVDEEPQSTDLTSPTTRSASPFITPLMYIPHNELQMHGIKPAVVPDLVAAFTFSVGFQAQKSILEASDLVSFYSRSICTEVSLEYRSYVVQNLTDNFLNGIATLPSVWPGETDTSAAAAKNRTLLFRFIQEFGTHYVHRVVLGAKRIIAVTLKRDVVAQLKAAEFNIAEAAAFDVSTSPLVEGVVSEAFALAAQKSMFDELTAFIVDRREVVIGGSSFIGWEQWARSVGYSNRAVPVQTSLKPLYTLLNGPRALALKNALSAYMLAAIQSQTPSDTPSIAVQQMLTVMNSTQTMGGTSASAIDNVAAPPDVEVPG